MANDTGAYEHALRRARRWLAAVTAAVTASTMLALAVSAEVVPTEPEPAVPVTIPEVEGSAAGAPESVEAACNNTFSPTKFPLTYQITATPSANPVPAGESFTVEFDVTLVASAGFLNGVYEILGPVAIPIVKNQATIGPLTGATGPTVKAVMASTFNIPAPASTPVTAGASIPIGKVTGTYTATGDPATFTLVGNSWAPTDTRPPGVTQAGWQGSGGSVALTSTGSQTYAQASLAGGVIKPFLVCMGGTWTPSGDTYVTPLRAAVAFGSVTVSGGTTTTTTTGSTTTTTTGSTTTTTTGSTSTTSTLPPTTSTTSTTVPPPGATEVTGTASYAADCTTDVSQDVYALTFQVTGTTRTNVRSGDVLDIVDQSWRVSVPGDLLELVTSISGRDSVQSLVTAAVAGKNTAPGVASPRPLAVRVGPILTVGGEAQPLTVSFRPGDVRFQATGGNAEFRMGRTTMVVTLTDALDVTLTCTPAPSSRAFVVSVVSGPPIATTTTSTAVTGVGAPTDGVSGGGGDAIPTGSGELARTGSSGRTLLIQILAGLLLVQLGYLCWSVVAPLRPARARLR